MRDHPQPYQPDLLRRKFGGREILCCVLILLTVCIAACNQVTLQPTPSPIVTRTPTATPAPSPTLRSRLSPPASPGPDNRWIAPSDGMTMVYIPAGEFGMGMEEGGRDAGSSGKPQFRVYLDAFWIDLTEVTNAMYSRCVQAGVCKEVLAKSSYTRPSYFDNPQFADFPVIYMDWERAKTYCQWAGRQLPTEAEWEKAARGTDGRSYPWGNNPPDCSLANYILEDQPLCASDSARVGSYPKGASPYGVLDMTGNVCEWTQDWLNLAFPRSSPAINPLGPPSGTVHVLRGGSWDGSKCILWAQRYSGHPDDRVDLRGVRCALTP